MVKTMSATTVIKNKPSSILDLELKSEKSFTEKMVKQIMEQ